MWLSPQPRGPPLQSLGRGEGSRSWGYLGEARDQGTAKREVRGQGAESGCGDSMEGQRVWCQAIPPRSPCICHP